MNKSRITWFLKLKSGLIHSFYCGISVNPLELIPDFNQGECWCIDAHDDEVLFDKYQRDPTDDSFVLIPKSDVLEVFSEII